MALFTFGTSNTSTGVDIGTSSVKIVQLKKSPSGPELVGYAMAPLPPAAVDEGNIKDAQTVAAVIKDVLKTSKLRCDRSFASISGQNVIMRFTKLPIMTPDELEQTVRIEAEQYVPYIFPQEYGNKCDVRWAAVTDARGRGLLASAPAGGPWLNASVQQFSTAELTRAAHPYELNPCGETILNLDHLMAGLGSNSCGPDVLPAYELPSRPVVIPLGRPCAS